MDERAGLAIIKSEPAKYSTPLPALTRSPSVTGSIMAAKILASRPEVVVLYLRMSGERQEHSIPAQRAELLAFAQRRGYRVLGEYTDEAISGDDTKRRAGFLRMRE